MKIVNSAKPAPHPQSCAIELGLSEGQCEAIATWCSLIKANSCGIRMIDRVDCYLHGAILFCRDQDAYLELIWLKNYIGKLSDGN